MKYLFLLWYIGVMWNIAYPQIITVKDLDTGDPIPSAILISKENSLSTITNQKGQANLNEYNTSDSIIFRRLGYQSMIQSYQNIQSHSFIVYLESANFNLGEVVVSATRWRQTSDNIPARITTIYPRQIALQNPQTAADLLGISGKVFIQKSQQGGGSPMIRGFATNRLLYAVDGVRMNNAIFRGGNIQNVINLDPFAVERTEVLFGPGSVIYGSDAIGGVMSFQTLTPSFSATEETSTSGKAIARYSSVNNERTGHFHVNVGKEKWAWVTSISSWHYDHLRQGRNGPDGYLKSFYVQRQDRMDRVITQDDPLLQIPSTYAQFNLMQKVRFAPAQEWDFQYGFHFSETSAYGRYDRHNRLRNGLPRYAEWRYGPQKWMMNHLQITHDNNLSYMDQMTLRIAHQAFEESRISRNFNQPSREIRIEEVDAYSINLDFVKSLRPGHTLYYGAEYVLNDINSTGINEQIETSISRPGPSRYPQASWQSLAFYLDDSYKLSEYFTLQAGLRYNHYRLNADFDTTFFPFPFTSSQLEDGSLTGSIGGVYRPSDTWVISANLGTAFRSPNVDDIGKVFDSEPGAVTVPNPDLSAEYAYNLDLGIARVFGEILKIDLTGYYTLLQNAMVRRNFRLNDRDSIRYDGVLSQVQAIQNAAEARVYGLQAGIEIKLPGGFSITSDYNVQEGTEETDDGTESPTRHAAPAFGVSRLMYSDTKLNLQLYAMYQRKRSHDDLAIEERNKTEIYALDENGNSYSPGWYTLNIKGMYQLNENLSVSAGLENITDQRYRPYSSGISGAGRNFSISTEVTF